jgi:hypothetical protein
VQFIITQNNHKARSHGIRLPELAFTLRSPKAVTAEDPSRRTASAHFMAAVLARFRQ